MAKPIRITVELAERRLAILVELPPESSRPTIEAQGVTVSESLRPLAKAHANVVALRRVAS